jgi:hypothetical protein
MQEGIRGKIADELFHQSLVPRAFRQITGDFPQRALFTPEKHLSGGNATGVSGLIEGNGAIHQHDDLAIVVENAGQRRLQGWILTSASGPEEEQDDCNGNNSGQENDRLRFHGALRGILHVAARSQLCVSEELARFYAASAG